MSIIENILRRPKNKARPPSILKGKANFLPPAFSLESSEESVLCESSEYETETQPTTHEESDVKP